MPNGLYGQTDEEDKNPISGQQQAQPQNQGAVGSTAQAAAPTPASAPAFTNFEDVFNKNSNEAAQNAQAEVGKVRSDAGGLQGRDTPGSYGITGQNQANTANKPPPAKAPEPRPNGQSPSVGATSIGSGQGATLAGKQASFDTLNSHFAPNQPAPGQGPAQPGQPGQDSQALEGESTKPRTGVGAPPPESPIVPQPTPRMPDGTPDYGAGNVTAMFGDGTGGQGSTDQRVTSAQEGLAGARDVANQADINTQQAKDALAGQTAADQAATAKEADEQAKYNKAQSDVASYQDDGGEQLLKSIYGDGAGSWDAAMANQAGARSGFDSLNQHFGGYGDEYAKSVANNSAIRQRDMQEQKDFLTQADMDQPGIKKQIEDKQAGLNSALAQVDSESHQPGMQSFDDMTKNDTTHTMDFGMAGRRSTTARGTKMAEGPLGGLMRGESVSGGDMGGGAEAGDSWNAAKDFMTQAGIPPGEQDKIWHEFKDSLPEGMKYYVESMLTGGDPGVDMFGDKLAPKNTAEDWSWFNNLFNSYLAKTGRAKTDNKNDTPGTNRSS